MGGLMFILGIFVSILICGWKGMMAGDFEHLYIFFFALIFGGIGFLDDFEKVKHKQNLGLTAIQKFLLQLAAAVAFLCLMRFEGMLTPNLYVPFFNTQIVMSWWVYMVFAAFVIVGTVGFVYICETLSDILQVIYFKATHGKRLFKMAPLHHHFELCGWSEVKLVAVFTSVSALCCLAALFGVLNRFHF